MSARRIAWTVGSFALAVVFAAAPAAAGDRTPPPTTPTNLHITDSTPSSVSLAWSPSTSGGKFWYCVQQGSAGCFRVDPPQTTFTRSGLAPDQTFTFSVYAIGANGKRSGNSNSVSYTTPPDTTPPSPAPTLTATTVLPIRASLSWTASTDDRGGQVSHTLFIDGVSRPVGGGSYTVEGLAPDTTYTFKVTASDASGNTAESNVLSVTTPPVTDFVPPSAPGNLTGFDGGCGEGWLSWNASSDNVDPPSAIRYDAYVNGQLAPESSSTFGTTSTIAYALVQGTNTFVVRAVDSSGNVSEPSNELPIPGMWPC